MVRWSDGTIAMLHCHRTIVPSLSYHRAIAIVPLPHCYRTIVPLLSYHPVIAIVSSGHAIVSSGHCYRIIGSLLSYHRAIAVVPSGHCYRTIAPLLLAVSSHAMINCCGQVLNKDHIIQKKC